MAITITFTLPSDIEVTVVWHPAWYGPIENYLTSDNHIVKSDTPEEIEEAKKMYASLLSKERQKILSERIEEAASTSALTGVIDFSLSDKTKFFEE